MSPNGMSQWQLIISNFIQVGETQPVWEEEAKIPPSGFRASFRVSRLDALLSHPI